MRYLEEFDITDIKKYVTERHTRQNRAGDYPLEAYLALLSKTYHQLVARRLRFEPKSETTYLGREWLSKPAGEEYYTLIESNEDLLNEVFGHEVYCEINTQLNRERRLGL